MEILRFSKAVRRVMMLQPGPLGTLTPTLLYEDQSRKKKKKKQTRVLRPLGRAERQFAKAQRVYWDTMVKRHNRSNEKKRDGWARDIVNNTVRAAEKSSRQLRRAI